MARITLMGVIFVVAASTLAHAQRRRVENDPSPRIPTLLENGGPDPETLTVREQAGVGGRLPYASAGVLEVGGTGSLLWGPDYLSARFAPFVGWFVADGLAISYHHELYGGRFGGQTRFSTLAFIEPSGHLGLTDRLLAFAGVGVGVLYNGNDFAFAMRPRAGLDVLVGRSGIFRPALVFTWATRDLVDLDGTQVAGMRYAGGMEVSYAAMF
ncbi:MAG: hypothetical protein KF901_13275 [Myxococcales bacterium]|nr:hypothetical protein [Myxococcales bacterium]